MRHDDVVIVTGAGGAGCGRSIALCCAGEGAAVVVSDIDDDGGRETVARIESAGGRAAFYSCDVRDDHQTRHLVTFAARAYGPVTVLVNNASSPEPPVEGIEGWRPAIDTDLLGTISMTRWALESMRSSGGGAIVNIASTSAVEHGRLSPGGFPGYDIAKAGVIRMTTGLARVAAEHGVRVNCLAPGWIATGGALAYWQSLTPDQRHERGVPSRLLTPDQVAKMVVTLATDNSLNGRIVVWWSESQPRLIAWGDRGYAEFSELA
jgi:NAD(P)-dependent dehydrogenase (short-subunit alcohol dehydrogenase family)